MEFGTKPNDSDDVIRIKINKNDIIPEKRNIFLEKNNITLGWLVLSRALL